MTYLQRNIFDGFRAIVALALAMLIVFILSVIFSGCKTRYITQEIPVVLHDRDSIVSVQHLHTHDTLLMRDSVFTIVKGDTIRIERWHTMQAVNHIARIDTLWRERIVEQPVQVKTTEVKVSADYTLAYVNREVKRNEEYHEEPCRIVRAVCDPVSDDCPWSCGKTFAQAEVNFKKGVFDNWSNI